MNPPDDERDVSGEYRRASAEDAGRPGAAVRNAILAEAAAAARRRAPAANDARYLWRGVAGVAVLGFAVLMWKQVDHHLPGDAPVMAAREIDAQSDALPPASPAAAVVATKPAEPAAEASAPQSRSSVAPSEGQATLTDKPETAVPASPPAPAPQRAGVAEAETEAKAESSAKAAALDEAADSMQRAQTAAPAMAAADRLRNQSSALGKMSAAQDAQVDADALLRRYFPQQYQSDTPRSVWLVQDANGNMLRSGELAAGKDLAELRQEIERDLAGSLLRPWRIRTLQNARGQSIQLAIAQTP